MNISATSVVQQSLFISQQVILQLPVEGGVLSVPFPYKYQKLAPSDSGQMISTQSGASSARLLLAHS